MTPSLGFSEELKGGERNIAKAVIISAVLACVLIMVPLISAIVAAPDLKEFFSDTSPVVYSVQASLGDNARVIVDIGVSVALFNAMLSLLMYFGRGVYTTGRDDDVARSGQPGRQLHQQVPRPRRRHPVPGHPRGGAGVHLRAELPDHLLGHGDRGGVLLHRPCRLLEQAVHARRGAAVQDAPSGRYRRWW